MANPVLLNNIDHKDLRIVTRPGADLGDARAFVQTFPAEFRQLQAHYPIIFRKDDASQAYEPIALFGFESDENLFLEGQTWDAAAIPLLVSRMPFLIGQHGEELMIHVDLDNPRVSNVEGEAVFLPHGGMSPYLENVNSMLLAIHEGMQANAGFIEALLKNELLEGFSLDITLDDGSQHRFGGFYTVNEERLAALDAATLDSLHKAGYLAAIYFQIASLSNFRSLIDRKNRKNTSYAARG
ncbi:SapC family protein [uncultured Massilia sp.]|uniref:SapC family protein n=1 Tax=uncultured Massilia sp. TaxID=169973 RepID=UPI00258BDAC9|nr:SapC family protein [uncultured Massilia sp.]